MSLVEAEQFIASWDEWRELAPRGNPPRKKKEPLFNTFAGLEVRVALVRAPDYNPRNKHQVGCSADAYRLLRLRFSTEPVESFVVLCLTPGHRVDNIHVVARGGIASVDVHPRHVFQAALVSNAASVIVAHNHPSGDPEPSHDDLVLTRRLAGASAVLGIPMLDHIIVGSGRYVSLADRGAIPELRGFEEATRAAMEGLE